MKLLEVTGVLPSPPRPADGHKGTFGTVLILGGSRGMSGAAALAGVAALRSGAGLVYVATPMSIQPIVAAYEPSYLTVGCSEDDAGRISDSAITDLESRLGASTAFAVGPGLGQSDSLMRLVPQLFEGADKPAVFDADALNALAKSRELHGFTVTDRTAERVLTPHPGEFARLMGYKPGSTTEERIQAAAELAQQANAVVVLKGKNSIITDGARYAVNTTGNSGMATGGTGDVLTGLITGLLAQRLPAFDAARLGAYLHGLSGDIAAEHESQPALIASDLLRFLGAAWKQHESQSRATNETGQ